MHSDLWLPDECQRFRKAAGDPDADRLCFHAGGECGGFRHLQYLYGAGQRQPAGLRAAWLPEQLKTAAAASQDRAVRVYDAGTDRDRQDQEKLPLRGSDLRHTQSVQIRPAAFDHVREQGHDRRYLAGDGPDRGRTACKPQIPLQIRDQYHVRLQ